MEQRTITAYLIRRRPYQETGALLALFTAKGVVHVIARGLQQKKAARAVLEPFSKLWLSLTPRGDCLFLNKAQSCEAPLMLAGKELFCGFYLNELVLSFVKYQDDTQFLFERYGQVLHALASQSTESASVLRLFEKYLLEFCGYGLPLSPFRQVTDGHYYFDQERGFVACHRQHRRAISAYSLHCLATEQLQEKLVLIECRQLMRQVIDSYLKQRPIHSRELWQPVGSFADSST